jgi:hypothetical protein
MKGIEIIEITTAVEISDELKNIHNRFQNLKRFQNKTVEIRAKGGSEYSWRFYCTKS